MGELGSQLKNEKQWLFLIILIAFFLRIIKVGSLPALYTDEASFGYNAYSILKTGRDEYNQPFPLILRSFGDYKPALSSYLAIPFIALLGLNELAVRLPSVILGTLTVLFVYLLTKEIFEKQTASNHLPLIASFLLAINPWHIHLTRMTMLVGIELFFVTGGIYFLIKGVENQAKFLLLSAFFLSLAFYAYYGARLTIPLLLLGFAVAYRKKLLKRSRVAILSAILGFFLLLPLLFIFWRNPHIFTARVKWVSLFRYPEVRSKIWQASTLDEGLNPLFIRFLHNKPLFYGKDILRRMLQHLSPGFLLFQGDKAAPFDIWGMGVSYLLLYPFLIWGVFYSLGDECPDVTSGVKSPQKTAEHPDVTSGGGGCHFFKNFRREWLMILYWLLISLLPASLTAYTPAANRAFGMVVPLQIFIALGLVDFFKNLKRKKYYRRVTLFLSVLFLLNFSYFLVQYFYTTPRKIPEGYHYGQKELVNFIVEQEKNYPRIIASSKATSYVYFLFYKRYPPESYWQESSLNSTPDDFGFEHVEGFSKYFFRRDFDLESEEKREGILYIGYPWEIGEEKPAKYKKIKEILFPNGEVGVRTVEFFNPAVW